MGWGVSTIVKDNFGLVDSMEQYHNNTVLDNFNLQLLLTTQTTYSCQKFPANVDACVTS